VGVAGTVAFLDDLGGEAAVTTPQFSAAQSELLEPVEPQLGKQIQRAEVPSAGTQLGDVADHKGVQPGHGRSVLVEELGGQPQRLVDGACQQRIEDVVLGGEVVIQRGLPTPTASAIRRVEVLA